MASQVPNLGSSPSLLARLEATMPVVTHALMRKGIETLWITHVRGLAQSLHELKTGKSFAQLSEKLQKLFRRGVRVLLHNMMILGATRIAREDMPDSPGVPWIPGFATMCFAMAERLVAFGGFDGDELLENRAQLFEGIRFLQHRMIASGEYREVPIDAPGYTIALTDPAEYGVGRSTKTAQLAEVLALGRLQTPFCERLPIYQAHSVGVGERFPAVLQSDRFLGDGEAK